MVVAGGGDFRVVVPPPAVVVGFVEPPPLPGLPGVPPKPWFAGGTFSPGEGGDGGVIPGPEPLSGGRVGPVGGKVNAKLEIAPPPATAKRGISEACCSGGWTFRPSPASGNAPIGAWLNPPRSSRAYASSASSRMEAMITPRASGGSVAAVLCGPGSGFV